MAIVSDRVLEHLKKSFCESASESESEDSDTSDNASVNSFDTTSSVGEYPGLMYDPLPPNADFGVTLKEGEVNCEDGTRFTSHIIVSRKIQLLSIAQNGTTSCQRRNSIERSKRFLVKLQDALYLILIVLVMPVLLIRGRKIRITVTNYFWQHSRMSPKHCVSWLIVLKAPKRTSNT